MEGIKKGIGFFYISLILHFYLFLIIVISFDSSFIVTLLNPLKSPVAENETEPVIVDTETESTVKPLKGLISDKPNLDTGPLGLQKKYNYLNPALGPKQERLLNKAKGTGTEIKNDENGKDSVSVDILKGQNYKSLDQGDYHTPSFDPEMPPDVTMDNIGDVSLATIPEPYAAYFISMEKKVGENWGKFFPIFQYYEGIIKSGDVIVTFWVDKDGNVLHPVVTKSYGYTILDEACLNAVIYSKNFGPLPESIRQNKYIKVDFTFIYTKQ
jgi:TonB family protein